MTLGCKEPGGASGQAAGPAPQGPLVVATTTMIGDMAAQLGRGVVRVETIMRPGGDPHLHQPTPRDAKLVASCALVLINGMNLEGWIEDLVKHAGGQRPVITVSQGVSPIAMKDKPEGVDPHFWFDVQAWSQATHQVQRALEALVGEGSPEAARVRQNAQDYRAELARLEAWASQRLDSIPKHQRVLITSHDAFHYFGRAFGVEVIGVQGVSTEQEASQRDVANTIELVRARNVPAIFMETSVNPSLVQQIAREAAVKVQGPLYSDSLGAPGSGADTYVGMVVQNVRMITGALGGQDAPFEAASSAQAPQGQAPAAQEPSP